MPLNKKALGGNPGHEAIYGHGAEGQYKPFSSLPQGKCRACAFYELVERKKILYALCHLTGEKDPLPGQNGCTFIAGTWERVDESLAIFQAQNTEPDASPTRQLCNQSLTGAHSKHSLNFPNNTRPGNGLVRIPNMDGNIADKATAIHSPAGDTGKVENHISRCKTSSIGDDWRLRVSRGAFYPAFLF